jgi:transcription elongation GreA/GreB family factor
LKLKGDDGEIVVITAASPLGHALIGKCEGDLVSIGKKDFQIVTVH